MGMFSESSSEKPVWDLREHIKQMFPFVKTVRFRKDLMKLQTMIILETMDGQVMSMLVSDEALHYDFSTIMENLKATVAAQYTVPQPIYMLENLIDVLPKFEGEGPDYKSVAKKLVNSYNKSLAEKLKSLNLEEIMAQYSNKILSEEEKKIVQNKTYEYFHTPGNPQLIQPDVTQELSRLIPDLFANVHCPECGSPRNLKETIIHLNDTHRMSREYIADWLESTDLDLEFKEEIKK